MKDLQEKNVCGACTGALMVLGLMFGEEHSGSPEERQRSNHLNDRMMHLKLRMYKQFI